MSIYSIYRYTGFIHRQQSLIGKYWRELANDKNWTISAYLVHIFKRFFFCEFQRWHLVNLWSNIIDNNTHLMEIKYVFINDHIFVQMKLSEAQKVFI